MARQSAGTAECGERSSNTERTRVHFVKIILWVVAVLVALHAYWFVVFWLALRWNLF